MDEKVCVVKDEDENKKDLSMVLETFLFNFILHCKISSVFV